MSLERCRGSGEAEGDDQPFKETKLSMKRSFLFISLPDLQEMESGADTELRIPPSLRIRGRGYRS